MMLQNVRGCSEFQERALTPANSCTSMVTNRRPTLPEGMLYQLAEMPAMHSHLACHTLLSAMPPS
eukprot:7156658-Ditylum_brightwellii.AAC.1